MGIYSKADYDADVEQLERDSQSLSRLCAADLITGFQVLEWERKIEIERAQAKGKLLGTIRTLMDGQKRASCLNPAEHAAGCKCKRYYRVSEVNKQLGVRE